MSVKTLYLFWGNSWYEIKNMPDVLGPQKATVKSQPQFKKRITGHLHLVRRYALWQQLKL